MTLPLTAIARALESLEETIIFKLIDRAQFRHNAVVYRRGESGFSGDARHSLFELRLLHQEGMDAKFGRFCVPEERPFNRQLPAPKRLVQLPPTGLPLENYDVVNLTTSIAAGYLGLVPLICAPGDDGQYGSSVEHDVYAIQAVARRIHYGSLYVAESKFQDDPAAYAGLVKARDAEGLLSLLTRPEVEEEIIARVKDKVARAQAAADPALRQVVDPRVVMQFYRDHVIPLTKKGEVLYLLNRSRPAGRRPTG